MARTVTTKQAALRRAREKRLALDEDRDARDRRVEDATADVLLKLDERSRTEAALARINEQIGAGLRRLLDEGVGIDGAAKLAGLGMGEVRRLARPSVGRDRPLGLAGQSAPADSRAVSAAD